MNAPDKIYIPFVDLGEDGLCQAPIWWDKNKQDEKPECKGTIEYVRKDALLEWAKKEMGEWSSESNTAQGVKMGLALVLDKIESL